MTIASGTCGDAATWRLEDDGTFYVEGTGEMEDYDPAESRPWQTYASQIKSVVIGEGITHIGCGTFSSISGITSLSVASTVTSIGLSNNIYGPFRSTGLTEVVLPGGMVSIGVHAFESCTNLLSIDLGGTQTIGSYAFTECTSLKSVEMSNVQTVDGSAFYNCYRLKDIDLRNVVTIEYQAFYQCGLSEINLENVKTISANAFQNCRGLTNIIFGPNLESIGAYAFDRYYLNDTSAQDRPIRTFTLLGPMPTCGQYAVGWYSYRSGGSTYYNSDYKGIALTKGYAGNVSGFYVSNYYAIGFGDDITHTVEGDTLTLSGSGEMWTLDDGCNPPIGTTSCTEIYIGSGITPNSSFIELFKGILRLLSAPYLNTIDSSMFASSSNLESVDISGATTIGASAFSGCTKLREVKFSSAVTIGASAFLNCSLKKIEFPDTLTSIGSSAFSGHRCHGIIVPASVTSIGANAFTPATNAYRKHMTIVFRGAYISGTYTAPTGMMVHEFCKNEAENDKSADYAAGTVNSSHPVMIRTAGGWRVISTDMIDNT